MVGRHNHEGAETIFKAPAAMSAPGTSATNELRDRESGFGVITDAHGRVGHFRVWARSGHGGAKSRTRGNNGDIGALPRSFQNTDLRLFWVVKYEGTMKTTFVAGAVAATSMQ